jgi:hypothetical protein
MANNQRKMMRRMRAASGGMHDVAPGHFRMRSAEHRAIKRTAKKQIKTREERAWRNESSAEKENR